MESYLWMVGGSVTRTEINISQISTKMAGEGVVGWDGRVRGNGAISSLTHPLFPESGDGRTGWTGLHAD
jgi:hypothetical protein